MSIIVVEGVDASGKSTLLENARLEIKERYFVLLRHSCRPLVRGQAEAFLDMLDLSSSSLHIVVDRHPLISEPIYGPILRGKNLVEHYSPKTISTVLRNVNRIIYCRPPIHVIDSNLDKNPQLEGVKRHIDDLIIAYDKRMEELQHAGIPVRPYDYTVPTNLTDLFFGD